MKQTSRSWVKLPVLLSIIALAVVLLTATAMADSPSAAPASADSVHAPAVPTLPSTTYIGASSSGSVKGKSFKSSDILSYVSSTGAWSVYKTGSALGLPGNVNLRDFEVLANGDIIFAIDRTKTIAGLGKVTPRDVLRSSDGVLTFELVGRTVGLTSSSENIDAVAWSQNNKLLLSTVGSATINGISGKVRDEDLVEITDANGALYFDGSAINLKSSSEDLAAAAVDSTSSDKIIYAATKGSFSANSMNAVSGKNTDIFGLIPNSSGPVKSGFLFTFFNGKPSGLRKAIDGISVVVVPGEAANNVVSSAVEDFSENATLDSVDEDATVDQAEMTDAMNQGDDEISLEDFVEVTGRAYLPIATK